MYCNEVVVDLDSDEISLRVARSTRSCFDSKPIRDPTGSAGTPSRSTGSRESLLFFYVYVYDDSTNDK